MMMMMNCFVEWLTDETRLVLFPACASVRDPSWIFGILRVGIEPVENLGSGLVK